MWGWELGIGHCTPHSYSNVYFGGGTNFPLPFYVLLAGAIIKWTREINKRKITKCNDIYICIYGNTTYYVSCTEPERENEVHMVF